MNSDSHIAEPEQTQKRASIPLTDCDSCQTLKANIRSLIESLADQGWTIESITTEGGLLHLTFYRGPHDTEDDNIPEFDPLNL